MIKLTKHSLFVMILISLGAIECGPSLEIAFAPDSIHFSNAHPIKSSSIADLISLTLGYTTLTPLNWEGLKGISNVLHLPKISVTLEVSGHHNITNSDAHRFPIIELNDLDREFELVSKRTYTRFIERDPIIVKLDLPLEDLNDNGFNGNAKLFEYLPIKSSERLSLALDDPEISKLIRDEIFDVNDPDIKLFIIELGTVKQLVNALNKYKNSLSPESWPIRGLFWFQISGLNKIVNSNANNIAKSEAKRLTENLLREIVDELRILYKDQVLVTVIEQDTIIPPLVRRTRATGSVQPKDGNNTELNLAYNYGSEFHTAFAMLSFTTILIAISVFGLSVAMWNIDPGRDSIIYRMTSQRIKKDQ